MTDNKKDMRDTYTIYDDQTIGKVQIADEVVAIIAGLAATEVEGVASIYIYVKSNGLEYSCNKLSLAGKQYNYSFPNPFNGYFNILNSDYSSDLHISELPSWIQYDIEDMYQLMIDGII